MRYFLILASVLVVAAACGGDGGTSAGDSDRVSASDARPGVADDTRYTTTAVVLESPDHGPQLCLGAVAESYPPQCGGPDIVGWDWDAVEGQESASGTTWGTYTVVGTWDGAALTLTEPPAAPEPTRPSDREQDRAETPCTEPEGGWRVVDESRASDESMNAATAYARAQPSIGGVWIDQSINPAFGEEPVDERRMNDPTQLILNVSFTEDLDRHEDAIREVWGGALCVSEAPVSAAELARIRAEVEGEVGDFLFSSIDEVRGRVEIGVPVDAGFQERFDEQYGPGLVDVQARLRPVDR